MANKIRADRVKESGTFTGLDNVALSGSPTGFRPFSLVCITGDTFDYTITEAGTGNWESGVGTYVSATNTVERTTVISSSNTNSKVSFGSNLKYVFITIISSSLSSTDKAVSKAVAFSIALGG